MKVRILLLTLLNFLVIAVSCRTHHHKVVPLPEKLVGVYILLADDEFEGYENNATKWTPQLYEWQQEVPNVLFFCFIKPDDMAVPPAYQKLAASRGTGETGSVPADTTILFAIGGARYSWTPNPWPWLTSKAAAESMAETVAQWPELYGCDGIDLDLESGAGDTVESGENMVHFVRKLKQLNPTIIVTQPVYGIPGVIAENEVVNLSWDKDANSLGFASSVGIMVYSGTKALDYVTNYSEATKDHQSPIRVDVPTDSILLGVSGDAPMSVISKLAEESVSQDLMGVMVWCASVVNGFHYGDGDASRNPETVKGLAYARHLLDPITA